MIALREWRRSLHAISLRRPFSFGIARLESLTYYELEVWFDIAGRRVVGRAGENLAPRWFVKDPSVSLEDDVAGLLAIVDATLQRAIGFTAATPFEFWLTLYNNEAITSPQQPGLVTQLAVSLIERAMLDAWCRAEQTTLAAAVFANQLCVCGECVHAELGTMQPRDALAAPAVRLHVRHTVGLDDELAEIPTLLVATGVRRLKVKLCGDPVRDAARLAEIERCGGTLIDRYTLDGNENYTGVAPLQELFDRLAHEPALRPVGRRLAWIEQPLARAGALSDDVAFLLAVPSSPPMVLDESDDALTALPRALSLGYAGTTHKNCKGVFKSILAAMLLQKKRRAGRRTILSGEDLTIVAPLSQTQDLAVAALVGVEDIERNGQHYADGLSAFAPQVNEAAASEHSGLYRLGTDRIARLAIVDGQVDVQSSLARAFGG